MDDVKQVYRQGENKTREAARELDGHTVADDIGNIGDDLRQGAGNIGDKLRGGADRLKDEVDRRF